MEIVVIGYLQEIDKKPSLNLSKPRPQSLEKEEWNKKVKLGIYISDIT